MRLTIPILGFTAIVSALPQPSTPPPCFKITNVVSGGTGCPQGSINATWTDEQILPINFSKTFTASVGPTTDITESRKNCQLNLALTYTPGYAFAVYSATYTGYADLEASVTGVLRSTYYFSGSVEQQTSTSLSLTGPTRAQFKAHDDVPVAVWSPCGGAALFNVDVAAALAPAGAGRGVLGVARESGRWSESLGVVWRAC
ncbi:hypothetical protein EJ07DRAFT_130232 [Lizonia empirigonia]|nr:hypothetical protein EJ07DRAFT_130232 [Lizonia empirigonia]